MASNSVFDNNLIITAEARKHLTEENTARVMSAAASVLRTEIHDCDIIVDWSVKPDNTFRILRRKATTVGYVNASPATIKKPKERGPRSSENLRGPLFGIRSLICDGSV